MTNSHNKTFASVADIDCPPPEVGASGVSEEDVGASVESGLRRAFETTSESGEPRQVDIVRDGNEDIGVFGTRFLREQGAEHRDAPNAWDAARGENELAGELEESRAHVVGGAWSVLPGIICDDSGRHEDCLQGDACGSLTHKVRLRSASIAAT